jgi:predicted RNA-binding protein Jag
MKIKTDFVTNSSSSSFVVMGAYISEKHISHTFLQKAKEIAKEEGGNIEIEDILNELNEYVETLLSGTDVKVSTGKDDCDTVMVGIPYTKMNGNETLNQFKERSKNIIEEKLGIKIDKVEHIQECWEDR